MELLSYGWEQMNPIILSHSNLNFCPSPNELKQSILKANYIEWKKENEHYARFNIYCNFHIVLKPQALKSK